MFQVIPGGGGGGVNYPFVKVFAKDINDFVSICI